MPLVKNLTIFIIKDNSFNSTFTVDNHRKTIKKQTYVPNLIGREGVSKQAKCPNFVCPKVPREGGGLGNLGQCLKFYWFFFFEGIPQAISKQAGTELDQAQLSWDWFRLSCWGFCSACQIFLPQRTTLCLCRLNCLSWEWWTGWLLGLSYINPNLICQQYLER